MIPLLASDGPMGRGAIDNYVISPDLHRWVGLTVLVALAATTVWVARLAVTRRPVERGAVALIVVTELVLMAQALLGIKLLDQGSGFNQLYIHYIGGLTPLGLFMLAGWTGWRRIGRSAVPLAALVLAGTASAVMAFVIGQQFVNQA